MMLGIIFFLFVFAVVVVVAPWLAIIGLVLGLLLRAPGTVQGLAKLNDWIDSIMHEMPRRSVEKENDK